MSTSTTSSVLLVLILASSTVMGFNPSLFPQTSCRQYQTGGSKTILHARAGDSAKAIDDAVHKSRLYGPDSNEARVAWDIVEEIDAYLEPLLACTSAETAFGETPATTQSASNYANQMQNFSNLLNSVSPALAQIKSLATPCGSSNKLTILESGGAVPKYPSNSPKRSNTPERPIISTVPTAFRLSEGGIMSNSFRPVCRMWRMRRMFFGIRIRAGIRGSRWCRVIIRGIIRLWILVRWRMVWRLLGYWII